MFWITIAIIAGGIFWAIGAVTVSDDVIEHRSLDGFRSKYGKDLGLLLCALYRSFFITVWPVAFFAKFGIGIVRDVIKLVLGKTDKSAATDLEA